MASQVYNSYKQKVAQASIDWENDTIKVSLHTSSYTPDVDNHIFFDDLTNEVSDSNYTTGGKTISNAAANKDTGNDRAELDGDDVSWSSVTFTARYAVVYKDTGNTATSPLIAAIDFGSDQSASNGTFTVTWDAQGIVQIS